jgi:hypothetical protein
MTDAPVSAEAPAPDLVKLLLFRSSDEAGIGWTPTTVVHVPAGLLHNAADTITALRASERSAWNAAVMRDEKVERLTAENERLTAALERIDHGWETPMEDKAWRALARFMWETARAALKVPAHED